MNIQMLHPPKENQPAAPICISHDDESRNFKKIPYHEQTPLFNLSHRMTWSVFVIFANHIAEVIQIEVALRNSTPICHYICAYKH